MSYLVSSGELKRNAKRSSVTITSDIIVKATPSCYMPLSSVLRNYWEPFVNMKNVVFNDVLEKKLLSV